MGETLGGKSDSKNDNSERAERILDAAMKLIIHYGFDKTTVSDIADEAGVSKGAIYLHWDSKETLLEALLVREMKQFTYEWLAVIEADPSGGTLTAMFRHSMEILARRPLLRAMMGSNRRILGTALMRRDPDFFAKRTMMGHQFVALMQSVGAVRNDLDPAAVSYVMACINYGYLMIGDVLPEAQTPSVEIFMATMEDILARGLEPEGGADSEAGKRVLRQIAEPLFKAWDEGRLM